MFQEMPHQLQTAEGKKIIKNYNRIAKVLLEFEVLYHREWMRQVRRDGNSTNCHEKMFRLILLITRFI